MGMSVIFTLIMNQLHTYLSCHISMLVKLAGWSDCLNLSGRCTLCRGKRTLLQMCCLVMVSMSKGLMGCIQVYTV